MNLKNALRRYGNDCTEFFRDLMKFFPRGSEGAILAAIVTLGLVYRVLFINRSIEYDEGYAYIEFARHTLKWITSAYYVVNNHIFHTILVHFSTTFLGNGLPALRLPALIMGVLTIPAVFILSRYLYGKWVGFFSACITAIAPVQILISTRARGYSTITLFTLLLLLCAVYVINHRNRFAWSMMIIISALGCYTIPLMLHPLGVVFSWLFACGFTDRVRQVYQGFWAWFRVLITTGVLIFLLTAFLYLPVLINNDILALNVDPLPWGTFLKTIPEMLRNASIEWAIGAPHKLIVAFLLIGITLSLVFHRRIVSIPNIPLQGVFFISMTAIILLQEAYLVERSTFWMIPLFTTWAIAGFWGAVKAFFYRHVTLISQRIAWGYIILTCITILGCIYPLTVDPSQQKWSRPEAEAISQELRKIITQDDIVILSEAGDAAFWYYFDFLNVPQSCIRGIKNRPFNRALVIVYRMDETLDDVIRNYGPDFALLKYDKAQKILSSGGADVYAIPASLRVMQETFPEWHVNGVP